MHDFTHSNTRFLPKCPVCGSPHRQATNGLGRLVWCDGSPAETKREQTKRTKQAAQHKRELAAQATQHVEDRLARARAIRAQRKRHTRAKLHAQAQHAQRTDASPLDTIDRARFHASLWGTDAS